MAGDEAIIRIVLQDEGKVQQPTPSSAAPSSASVTSGEQQANDSAFLEYMRREMRQEAQQAAQQAAKYAQQAAQQPSTALFSTSNVLPLAQTVAGYGPSTLRAAKEAMRRDQQRGEERAARMDIDPVFRAKEEEKQRQKEEAEDRRRDREDDARDRRQERESKRKLREADKKLREADQALNKAFSDASKAAKQQERDEDYADRQRIRDERKKENRRKKEERPSTGVMDVVLGIADELRGTLGGVFGTVVGSILDVISAIRKAQKESTPTIKAAEGFSGKVDKPTHFLAGEAGPEHVNIQPFRAKDAVTDTMQQGLARSSGQLWEKNTEHYAKAIETVTERLPEKALQHLTNLGVQYHFGQGATWADPYGPSLTDKLVSEAYKKHLGDEYDPKIDRLPGHALAGNIGGTDIVLGGADPYRQYKDIGKYGEGAGTARSLLAHELTHSLDLHHLTSSPASASEEDYTKHAHSASKEWLEAYNKEILPEDDKPFPLSSYAASQPMEGFAEFGRLLYGSDVPLADVEKEFPKASAFFKSKGLWPNIPSYAKGGVVPEDTLAQVHKGETIFPSGAAHDIGKEIADGFAEALAGEKTVVDPANYRFGKDIGGQEHEVYKTDREDEEARYYKIARSEGGISGSQEDYFKRHQALNQQFPQLGYQLHGVTPENKPVISMNAIEGIAPSMKEIADWMTRGGWKQIVDNKTWEHSESGDIMGDVHPGNVKKTAAGEMIPIDVDYIKATKETAEALKKFRESVEGATVAVDEEAKTVPPMIAAAPPIEPPKPPTATAGAAPEQPEYGPHPQVMIPPSAITRASAATENPGTTPQIATQTEGLGGAAIKLAKGDVMEGLGDAALAAGGRLAAMVPVVGATIGVFSAVSSAFDAIVGALNERINRLAEYSPAISQQQGENEVKQMMNDMRRANEHGRELAELSKAQFEAQQKWEDIKLSLMMKIAPIITQIFEVVDAVLSIFSGGSRADQDELDPTSAILGRPGQERGPVAAQAGRIDPLNPE